MSITFNIYVMRGLLLPYNRDMTDEQRALLEEYQDIPSSPATNPKDGLTALVDGMEGKYVAIGHVVAKSRANCGLGEPLAVDYLTVKYNSSRMLDVIRECGFSIDSAKLGWLVISHYR